MPDPEHSRDLHPGQRDVMRRLGPGATFAACPVCAVDDRGLQRTRDQIDSVAQARGLKAVGSVCSTLHGFGPPVFDPDPIPLRIRPRFPQGPPAHPLLEMELTSLKVGDCEVREIDVSHRPTGCGSLVSARFGRAKGAPEKCPLEAEALARLGLQMPGVVPPLGLVAGVRGVIPREPVGISGSSDEKPLRRFLDALVERFGSGAEPNGGGDPQNQTSDGSTQTGGPPGYRSSPRSAPARGRPGSQRRTSGGSSLPARPEASGGGWSSRRIAC